MVSVEMEKEAECAQEGGKLSKISLNLFLGLQVLKSHWEALSVFGVLIE